MGKNLSVKIKADSELQFYDQILSCFIQEDQKSEDLLALVNCLDIDIERLNYIIDKFNPYDEEVNSIIIKARESITTNFNNLSKYAAIIQESEEEYVSSPMIALLKNIIAKHLAAQKLQGIKNTLDHQLSLYIISSIGSMFKTAISEEIFEVTQIMKEGMLEHGYMEQDGIVKYTLKKLGGEFYQGINNKLVKINDINILQGLNVKYLYVENQIPRLRRMEDKGDIIEIQLFDTGFDPKKNNLSKLKPFHTVFYLKAELEKEIEEYSCMENFNELEKNSDHITNLFHEFEDTFTSLLNVTSPKQDKIKYLDIFTNGIHSILQSYSSDEVTNHILCSFTGHLCTCMGIYDSYDVFIDSAYKDSYNDYLRRTAENSINRSRV